jgi:hypothetical protein
MLNIPPSAAEASPRESYHRFIAGDLQFRGTAATGGPIQPGFAHPLGRSALAKRARTVAIANRSFWQRE